VKDDRARAAHRRDEVLRHLGLAGVGRPLRTCRPGLGPRIVGLRPCRPPLGSRIVGLRACRPPLGSRIVGLRACRPPLGSRVVGLRACRTPLGSRIVGLRACRPPLGPRIAALRMHRRPLRPRRAGLADSLRAVRPGRARVRWEGAGCLHGLIPEAPHRRKKATRAPRLAVAFRGQRGPSAGPAPALVLQPCPQREVNREGCSDGRLGRPRGLGEPRRRVRLDLGRRSSRG
jgi:hypothetical protein